MKFGQNFLDKKNGYCLEQGSHLIIQMDFAISTELTDRKSVIVLVPHKKKICTNS